ncbi:MAG: condensation domain-containing protein, partial [Thiohalocapsa sp.]|uniref:condensation domain-containing protein n=1 Tax=Thiohalocapsa sp. TaxID=2497641 RepID=UPI0025DCE537
MPISTTALPLSDCQSGYLAATAGDPTDPVHNTALPLLFDTPVSADLLRAAVAALMARHAMLRTAVRLHAGSAPGTQWPTEPIDWWQEIDARGLDRNALLSRAAADLRRPFTLENGLFRATLYQGAAPGPLLLLALHHIAGDAPTWGILGRELVAGLAALAAGKPIDLPPLKAGHADYVRWEQDLLASDRGRRMASYWHAQLAGDLPLLQLPTDHPRPPTKTFNGATRGLALPAQLTQGVHALSAAQSCTRFSVLLTAWLLLLHQWTGQDDVWLLVPTSMPRQQPRFRDLAGLLISPLIVRLR